MPSQKEEMEALRIRTGLSPEQIQLFGTTVLHMVLELRDAGQNVMLMITKENKEPLRQIPIPSFRPW